jgi:hypothetical protein
MWMGGAGQWCGGVGGARYGRGERDGRGCGISVYPNTGSPPPPPRPTTDAARGLGTRVTAACSQFPTRPRLGPQARVGRPHPAAAPAAPPAPAWVRWAAGRGLSGAGRVDRHRRRRRSYHQRRRLCLRLRGCRCHPCQQLLRRRHLRRRRRRRHRLRLGPGCAGRAIAPHRRPTIGANGQIQDARRQRRPGFCWWKPSGRRLAAEDEARLASSSGPRRRRAAADRLGVAAGAGCGVPGRGGGGR